MLVWVEDRVTINNIGGKAKSFEDGVKLAAEIIDSGKAYETLEKMIDVSNR